MERHAAFTVPFGTRDFCTTQTTGNVYADTQGTHTHGVLYRTLHGTTERNPAFQLLCDGFTNKGCVQLWLAHFNDVEVQVRFGDLGDFLAQTFDVCTLLADDHTGARCVDRNAALLVWAFDDHTGDTSLCTFFLDEVTDGKVFEQKITIVLRIGVPAAVPGAVDLKTHTDRIYFVTHQACSST